THLQTACFLWAKSAKGASPGARAYYWALRGRDKGDAQATRALANRLVGILHGCLRHRTGYDEARAWPQFTAPDATEPPDGQTKSCKMTGTPSGSDTTIARSA